MRGWYEPDILDMYRHAWQRMLDVEGEPDWRDDDQVQMFQTGQLMAALYWERVLLRVTPTAVEQRFETRVPGVPTPLVGYVDMILDDGSIRERKTTSAKVTSPKSKWRFQGMVYSMALGLPLQWDVVTRQVSPQLYTADDWPSLRLQQVPVRTTQGMVRDLAYQINELHSRFGPDQVWPTRGVFHDWICGYCGVGPRYANVCPVWA
jgi:hypothetical protein